jgi:hypothetical protein
VNTSESSLGLLCFNALLGYVVYCVLGIDLMPQVVWNDEILDHIQQSLVAVQVQIVAL